MLLHFTLCDFDVVGDAVMEDSAMLAVIDGVAGAGISVAGLPYTAGVDDQPIVCKVQSIIAIVIALYKEFLVISFDEEFGKVVGVPVLALYVRT